MVKNLTKSAIIFSSVFCGWILLIKLYNLKQTQAYLTYTISVNNNNFNFGFWATPSPSLINNHPVLMRFTMM